MELSIKEMELRFSENVPYLYHNGVLVCGPSGFGYVYNQGPPHDHNRYWKEGVYLEDLPMDFFDGNNRMVRVVVMELCPIHIGKDCVCETGLDIMTRTYEGKVILDLYHKVIVNLDNNEYFFS